jgi:hypothetical protein
VPKVILNNPAPNKDAFDVKENIPIMSNGLAEIN